jgi:nucleotide-binding universal stress UspA family protein
MANHGGTNHPVVVGVDGSADALRAVDWAAAEATRHGWQIRLVHAYQAAIAALPAVAVPLPPPVEEADHILDEARSLIAVTYPDLSVSVARHEGPAPRVLLRESEQARLLVLGREGLGRFSELILGSVSLAVATRARTPVVVIPAAWNQPEQSFNRLVVGVDGSDNCQAAVRFAFETAADHGAELTAVFARDLPTRWPEAVPIMAVAAIMANLSRVLVWWREVDWRACLAYAVPGIPAAALGARTLLVLPSHAVDIAIGVFLNRMVSLLDWTCQVNGKQSVRCTRRMPAVLTVLYSVTSSGGRGGF